MRKKKPLPTTLVPATIERITHEGRGVARIDGKTVFVDGALPDEKITFQYTALHASYDEAIAVEILEPHPARATPRCSYVNTCAGCSLQHMEPDEQLRLKQNVLSEQLQHFGGQLSPQRWLSPITSEAFGYRRKARFSVRYVEKKQTVLVGFRENNGRYVADMQDCVVLDPQLAKLIPLFRELIMQLDAKRAIPQIEVALGLESPAVVIRHLELLSEHDKSLLEVFAKTHAIDCYLQAEGVNSIVKFYPNDQNERLSYALSDFNLNLRFHPIDFVQVNAGVNRQLVNKVIELLELTDQCRVLDLFCGLGNFTLPMATRCAHVTGVEGDVGMVDRGYENAAYNQIKNADFYACNLADDISIINTQAWAQESYDKVLIDPPRTGAAGLMPWLIAKKPQRIVYVSCNPATLARDAGLLMASGLYRFSAAGILDMFTHTTHVESIAVFDRIK